MSGAVPSTDAPQGRFDWTLLVCTLMLSGLGLLMILSASSLEADARFGDAFHFITRQLIGLGAGALLGGLALAVPWKWIRASAWPIYVLTGLALLAVMSGMGHAANGATRWINLGPVNVQPSEFAKVALVLMLSQYLANNEGRLRDVVGVVVPALLLITLPLALILFQKDFGTLVILLGLGGTLLFVAGLEWRYVLLMAASAAPALVGLILLEPFRVRRVLNFLDPFADPDGAGYQVVQGWIALATGGLTGAGLASGVAQRGFVPEAHTDFIAVVVGEELGAVGWTVMVLLLMGIVWRGLVIAQRARCMFGMLLATGLATLMAFQAIINLGVVGGILPNKGLVLPFMSYGASAAIVHAASIGLLLRISLEAAPAEADEGALAAGMGAKEVAT